MKKIIYEKPSVMAFMFHYKPYLLAGSGETPQEETPPEDAPDYDGPLG